jgi:hypothetical protein
MNKILTIVTSLTFVFLEVSAQKKSRGQVLDF